MPALDFASLTLLAFASMVVTALALPLAMGRQAIRGRLRERAKSYAKALASDILR